MTSQEKSDRDKQAQQAPADQPTAQQDPPYLVELIDEVIAAHPALTREQAREALLASGA